MKVAILNEAALGEPRVAATPETVGKLRALGADVTVEAGAGLGSAIADADYAAAGATIVANSAAALKSADVVLCVRRPSPASLKGLIQGALLIGTLDPYSQTDDLASLAKAGIAAFAMELMPRITRAQSMDVLSSQANLGGYQAVIEAAAAFGKALPMMMTAAGTVRPAKAFVMGAGVAGLQAIATARRLGAVVSATDVRPAAKEQVESLAAKFIAVEDEEFKQAETAAGYAKPMSAEYQAKQAELIAQHIAKQDIVITTALIPGRPAPRLVTAAMVESMPQGSVIVDLAAERGGNVELTQPGKVVVHKGVTIIGLLNLPGRIAASASQLYARNLLAFFETLVDKPAKALAVNWDDELVKATLLTRNGAVVHERFISEPDPQAAKVTPEKKVEAAKGARRTRKAPATKPALHVEDHAPAKTGTVAKTGKAKPVADVPVTAPAAPKKAAATEKARAPKVVADKPVAGPAAPAKTVRKRTPKTGEAS